MLSRDQTHKQKSLQSNEGRLCFVKQNHMESVEKDLFAWEI